MFRPFAASLSLAMALVLTACGGGGGGTGGPGGSGKTGVNWNGPTTLADFSFQAMTPTVLLSDAGLVTALWYLSDGTHVRLMVTQQERGGAWSAPAAVDGGTTDAICVQGVDLCERDVPAVIDTNGNVTAAWPAWDGTAWHMMANRFVPGQGWGTAEVLSATATVDQDLFPVTAANMLVDGQGRVSVFWRQFSTRSSDQRSWWHAWFDGASWTAAEISTPAPYGPRSAWAVHPASGELTFAWYDTTNGTTARVFTPGSGWGAPTVLQGAGGTNFALVVVKAAYDPSGIVTVAVSEAGASGGNDTLRVARHPQGGAWGATVTLVTQPNASSIIDTTKLDLITNNAGDVLVLTGRRLSFDTNVGQWTFGPWVFAYTAAGGWVDRSYVCCGNLYYGAMHLASTDAGGAFIVHDQLANGTQVPGMFRGVYLPTFDGAATPMFDVQVGASDAMFASTPNGHAVMAYSIREGEVRVRRYIAGQGWETEEVAAALAPAEAARPVLPINAVSVSPAGHVFVLYHDVDYEAFAGVYYDPATGWSAPGFFNGRTQRAAVAIDGASAAIAPDGHVRALINASTRAGTGLQAFDGAGQPDVPFSTPIVPRTLPPAPLPLSGGTGLGVGSCSGTNTTPAKLRNYIDQNISALRGCTDTQITTLTAGADTYYDAYLNAVNNLGCTEPEAYPTYAAHQQTALIAKRTAQVLGCLP